MAQACRHAAAWLDDVVPLACDWLGIDPAVVLVTPYDEVDFVAETVLGD